MASPWSRRPPSPSSGPTRRGRRSYEALWTTELGISIGRFGIDLDLRHWINDGLMAVFFFVIGLEIKRELVEGELREPRRAALPAVRRGRRDGRCPPCCTWRSTPAATEPTAGASRWPPTSPWRSACSACSAAGAGVAQAVPPGPRHRRRHRRHPGDRRLLHHRDRGRRAGSSPSASVLPSWRCGSPASGPSWPTPASGWRCGWRCTSPGSTPPWSAWSWA